MTYRLADACDDPNCLICKAAEQYEPSAAIARAYQDLEMNKFREPNKLARRLEAAAIKPVPAKIDQVRHTLMRDSTQPCGISWCTVCALASDRSVPATPRISDGECIAVRNPTQDVYAFGAPPELFNPDGPADDGSDCMIDNDETWDFIKDQFRANKRSDANVKNYEEELAALRTKSEAERVKSSALGNAMSRPLACTGTIRSQILLRVDD